MSTKLVDKFTEQADDFATEVTNLQNLLYDLDYNWAEMSKDNDIYHADVAIDAWEEALARAVGLETKLIPKQLERVQKLMDNVNQSFATVSEVL